MTTAVSAYSMEIIRRCRTLATGVLCDRACVWNVCCAAFTVYAACLTQEHEKIMYYYPESEIMDKKIRTVGLTTAIVGFSQ